MSSAQSFLRSSIGRKIIMALSGICLLLFVVGHLLGNFQIFQGPEKFNGYAAFLASIPGPLWFARIGLLLLVTLHVITGFQLNQENNKARPVGYRRMDTVQASPASLYMIHTGIVILLFVLIHLAHFTFGLLQPEFSALQDAQGRHDVYHMVVAGFQSVYYSGFYISCMLCLGFHLSHGFASFFQTLGFNHPKYTPLISKLSTVLAVLIALGYISIPTAVLLGKISLPAGG